MQYPNVVTYPSSAEQAVLIVQCAKSSGQYICSRNGKYSFESDTCTYGTVVDVSKMKQVAVLGDQLVGQDSTSPVVRLGAGLTLGQVHIEVEEKLGLVVPMGNYATVGLTGLILVGGHGPLSRLYGILSDYVSAVELVNDKGQIIRATMTNENADYLWLSRGGGSGMQHYTGIITAIELSELPRKESSSPNAISYIDFKIDYGMHTSVDDAVQMLSDWQDFNLDKANVGDPLFNRLTVEPWLFVDMMKEKGWKRKVYVTVYFYGTAKHREEFCSKYLPKLEELFVGPEKGEITNWQERTAVGFHRHLAGVKSNKELSSGKHGYALHDPWKGYSAVASKAVSKNAFRILAEGILESQPLTKRYVEIKSLGGAVKQLDKSETAFWHRDALWWSLSNHFFPKDVEMDSAHIHSLKNKSRRNHEKFIDAMMTTTSDIRCPDRNQLPSKLCQCPHNVPIKHDPLVG